MKSVEVVTDVTFGLQPLSLILFFWYVWHIPNTWWIRMSRYGDDSWAITDRSGVRSKEHYHSRPWGGWSVSTMLCLAIVLEGWKGFPGCVVKDGRKQAQQTPCTGACNKHSYWDWSQPTDPRYTNKGCILWHPPPQTGSIQTGTSLFIRMSFI